MEEFVFNYKLERNLLQAELNGQYLLSYEVIEPWFVFFDEQLEGILSFCEKEGVNISLFNETYLEIKCSRGDFIYLKIIFIFTKNILEFYYIRRVDPAFHWIYDDNFNPTVFIASQKDTINRLNGGHKLFNANYFIKSRVFYCRIDQFLPDMPLNFINFCRLYIQGSDYQGQTNKKIAFFYLAHRMGSFISNQWKSNGNVDIFPPDEYYHPFALQFKEYYTDWAAQVLNSHYKIILPDLPEEEELVDMMIVGVYISQLWLKLGSNAIYIFYFFRNVSFRNLASMDKLVMALFLDYLQELKLPNTCGKYDSIVAEISRVEFKELF